MPKQKAKAKIKIAYIGGGSVGWAQILMKDLAHAPELTGEIVLYDINPTAANHNVKRGKAIFAHREARTTFRVRATSKIAEALKGADFVIMSIQPGPTEMFCNDLDIPAKYGLIQTVGDTTGPGGISRALRAIPIYAGYAEKIMRHCPDAWVINYTNPMTLCTATLYAAAPGIKAFGCCHEVFGTQWKLAQLVKKYWKKQVIHRSEIKVSVNGVNHFTFVPTATWEGRDLYPLIRKQSRERGFFGDKTAIALENERNEKVFSSCGIIAFDFYRRFGVLGAAGDRHLAEFVPWYLSSETDLHRWGVILTRSDFRRRHRPEVTSNSRLAKGSLLYETIRQSGEEGVQQMLAILGLRDLDTNVNLPNRGQTVGLPLGHVVETNAQFRRDRVTPIVADPLPIGLSELQRKVAAVQEMVLLAGLEKDKDLAFQALLQDPQVHIPTDRAWKMFNELLRANQALMKGWRL